MDPRITDISFWAQIAPLAEGYRWPRMGVSTSRRNDLLFMQESTDSVPSLLVETFLDDRFRSDICTNLQDPEQRLAILHWLQDQQFSVYRLLSGPESSRDMFQKALFPLRPDSQKYYH